MTDAHSSSPSAPELRQRALAIAGPLLGLALFGVAVWILRREFLAYHLSDVIAHLRTIPIRQLVLASTLTGLGYFVLTGYDALACHYVGQPLRYRRIALSSFVAYVFSHNVGLSVFGGGAVRLRMLSGWGVRADDIARIVAFVMVTFWMGFLLLGGLLHSIAPIPLSVPELPLSSSRPIGWLLLALTGLFVTLTISRRRTFVLHGFRVTPPNARIVAAQFGLSCFDWMIAAGVAYTLLPSAEGLTFPVVLGAFLLAQFVGIASHVPGGLGVFDSAMVVLLKPWLAGDAVLAAIVAYRLIYYLLPLVLAVLLFGAYELRQRRSALRRTSDWISGWGSELIPRVFAITVFLAGSLLLLSGATPELPDRLAGMKRVLPLPLIELSKLLGSLIGVLLLLLANALRQRLDAGYVGTLVLLLTGAAVSLVKGFDWEEALILLFMAATLLPCREFFYRKSSLFAQSLSRGWWFAVTVVVVSSLTAFEFAYRHVEFSGALWWQFGTQEQAPRSLRATLLAAVMLLVIASLRLLRTAPRGSDDASTADLDQAQAILSRDARASANIALLGDKKLLFNATRTAFVMYGVSGRTWVAMGDPVGPESEHEELAWQFLELADRHAARVVFYEVSEACLPLYLELGLDLRKIGEEGRVPLHDFSLEGSERKGLRQTCHRMQREGCEFEIVPAAEVHRVLDQLEVVSNTWLADKNTREKRFSLGFFDHDYLTRLPVAVVRRAGRIVAFANVWSSSARGELTVDLMRYDANAPSGVMEYLFVQLMLWGRDQGYASFGLGMAPLAGLENHRLAPLWNRLGALLFRHGEHFYNFQGLRLFKEKFGPEWEPRYLAAPGGWTMPLVLTRIASLISGGVTGILIR